MNGFTRVMLVLLRLAIGWHFLVEGLDKMHSVNLGPTETNRPWTSEPYLREAPGPVGDYLRREIGDLDQHALARVTLAAANPEQEAGGAAPRRHLPQALEKDWDNYFERFKGHYTLDAAQAQKAEEQVGKAKDAVVVWLRSGAATVKKPFPSGVVERQMNMAQRIQDYRDTLKALDDVARHELPAFKRDVAKARLASLKADLRRQRAELQEDTDKHLHSALDAVGLSDEQKRKGPVPPAPPPPKLQWIDQATRWGLLGVGACLIAGLFTRLACVAGAGFLLSFYLTYMPVPWYPDNPRVEGHYLFVNKNLIEMLALLALATTASGRWLGLDGLIHGTWRLLRGDPPQPRAEPRRLPGQPR